MGWFVAAWSFFKAIREFVVFILPLVSVVCIVVLTSRDVDYLKGTKPTPRSAGTSSSSPAPEPASSRRRLTDLDDKYYMVLADKDIPVENGKTVEVLLMKCEE